MSASTRTVKKSRQGHTPEGPIDWTLPAHFSASDVRKVFEGVLLCLKKMGRRRWSAWEKHFVEYGDWSRDGRGCTGVACESKYLPSPKVQEVMFRRA